MAVRYGPLLASFVDRRDATNSLINNAQLGGIESAEIAKNRGQMVRGRFTLLKSPGWDGLVREGRIVSLYQEDGVHDASGRGMHREMGQFLIQTVRERLGQDGQMRVEVRGLGSEHLLTKVRHWEAIGKETIYSTELTANARGPWTTTMEIGAPHGNDSATLASNANFLEGDEIRIQMDNGDWYVGRIRNPDPVGPPGTIQMEPRIPFDASAENAVEGRRARLEVRNLTGLGVGLRVVITLNDGTQWTTLIEAVDLADSEIAVGDGLPSPAAVGRAVVAYDYSEPATDDVTQIMGPAVGEGWVVEFDEVGWLGTNTGTAHAPVGDSVWDLLTATVERTGEMFRIAPLQAGFIPRKRLRWLRTPDASGMTLYLRGSSADVAADTEHIDRGVIHSIERERENDLVTRVYPVAGDGRIDLEYCSEEGRLRAAVEGFSVVISDDLFVPDYVEYGPGREEHGVLEGTIRYGNVSLPKKARLAELNAAADGMLYQAMNSILESQAREYWRAEVHTHRPLWPGQTVQVVNQALAPTTTNTYHVLEVRESYRESGATAGVIMSSVLLSREAQLRPTATVQMARQMRANEMAARRMIVADEGEATTVVSGGGGETPGPHEHGEFLRVDGTRMLVGNLAVGDGVTFDGVDVGAHAGNPAAHHAPVTAGDGSVLVEGQAVRVADGFAGEGLLLAGGVARVNTAVGQGTQIAGDVVGVAADPAGGLEVAAAGARVKRPGNSGVKLSTAGMEIVPGSVGAKTTNSVVAETHYHEGYGVTDSKVTPGEMMKSDGAGDHRLRWLNADRVRTPLVESESGPVTVDPVDGVMNVDGDVVLVGAGRAIRSAVGQGLLVAPAGRLMLGPGDGVVELQAGATLKSAHWASGFLGTGWGMTYPGALDCRSVTADEMIVQTFIADAARVRVGQLWVTPGAALLAEAFTVPAVGAVGTLVVEDAPGLANWPVFDAGDWVMLQGIDRRGGGLRAGLMGWGQVSGYVDGPGEGQQSWSFTCRQTAMPGQVVGGGVEVLGFAKAGAGWINATTTDAAGSPYLGMSIWRGDNPYADGNRVHFLRIGQLRGVTGVWEQGFFVGQAGGRRLKWSELGPEIHGARQSLYAGDGAQARVVAAEVRLARDVNNYVTLTPNGDGVATNVISSGSGYAGQIDDAVDAPTASDWVANGLNSSGQLSVQLTDPAVWGAVYGVTVRAVIAGVGFSSDSVRVFGQVVASDEVTPLTGEELLATLASNVTTTVSKVLRPDTSATQAQWNGARLRLRWDYSINSAKEAIRLDPQVPSIAVGMGLPTGTASGGAGFWAGAEGGLYKARIGDPAGARLVYDGNALTLRSGATGAAINFDPAAQSIAMGATLPTGTASGGAGFWAGLEGGAHTWRVGGTSGSGARIEWDGSRLAIRAKSGAAMLRFDNDGLGYIAGPLNVGAEGGIWQAVGGTWDAPRGGLKIWNAGGVGRLATFDGGGATQVEFDSTGALKAGAGIVALDKVGLHVYHAAGGDEVVRVRGQGIEFIDTANFTDSYGVRFFRNAEEYGNVQGLFSTATGERTVRVQAVPPASTSPARVLVQALSGSKAAGVNAFANSAGSSLTLSAERVIVTNPLQVGSVRFLPMATKPTVPAGYVELYAYQNGANAQIILRNRLGTEVVLGTVVL